MFKNFFLNFTLFSFSMFLFRCETPKEISEAEFKNLIHEMKNLHELNQSRTIDYLGIESEKAILKVSNLSPGNFNKRKEEFFYTKASPSLITWIDENLYKITISNYNKLYKYLLRQSISFDQYTFLTQDNLENTFIEKRIKITKNKRTVFIFYLRADGITCFSLNIKHSPNKEDLKYKGLWLKMINEILK
ncbi:hypothetical protein LEP1GSC188_2501 [Leptospira weilii serovar Topaz str. LT2116]|uniref:Uncharacterized protein n=1 Tax=Leptospira weilii serovar Topaz str. LT2116 TaxID=1088540 RepID=M3FIB2_9LEPT|nr:hypothetical protein LEP1GSC188_2501 [Leptospira weilii serovar Topaz str. LT2116]